MNEKLNSCRLFVSSWERFALLKHLETESPFSVWSYAPFVRTGLAARIGPRLASPPDSEPFRMIPSPSYRPGDLVDQRFRIQRLLGRGMSEVYEVMDEEFKELRALKVLAGKDADKRTHAQRLLAEAAATRRIEHPNVVHVCAIAPRNSPVPYFVMELLRGETLREHIERHGPIAPRRALELIGEAAAGLAAAHNQDTFHRDVKPDNLFLCGSPKAVTGLKVIDFGLARQSLGGADAPSQGDVMGTAEYMAPEQVVADPADARSDIYSLGVVLFRLLTQELPFDLVPQSELLAHQLASIAPPPSWLVDGLDPSVDILVATAVRKAPENRYPTMQALLDDIERVTTGKRANGVRLQQSPDRYLPQSSLGRQALTLLTRHHSSRPAPVES